MTELKEGYKKSEIGVIPIKWDVVKVGEILNVQTGKMNAQDQVESGEYPFFTRSIDVQTIDTYAYDTEALFIAGEGNFKVKYYNGKFNCHQRTYMLTSKNDNNMKFLLNAIQPKVNKLISTSVGSTVQSLRKPIIEALKIPLPPLKEQEKIADILSTVDEKIDAIATQIEKAQTLKKGLLQKLLSEGIGESRENHQLLDDFRLGTKGDVQSTADGMSLKRKMKDSELGKIPESWEVVELATITTILLSNVDKKSKDDEQDVKLCNYMDVYNNQYITNDLVYMEATAKNNQIEKFQLQINDVIITKDSETKDDIAIPAVVKETFENLICGYHLAVLRPKENILYGVYLMKAIQSVNVHKHFEKLANGITRFGLTSSAINQALIPLPPLKEQKQIAEILSTADEKLEVLRAKKQMYETLKKGLLQKLLNGEVRV